MVVFSENELNRYARQLIIPGWGEEKQKRLKSAKVFIAGAGGLGSPSALCLALAGVGLIRICDCDSPEHSNLNRQFLHSESRIGVNKAISAMITLRALNPYIEVQAIPEKITESNVDRLVADSELIVDCLDNFKTRQVLNAYAVKNKLPLIHGSIWGLEGRVTVFHPPETACLTCLFPESPPEETFPVVGATPGIIGMIQAMEAIKYLAGIGELLKGRLLCCDFLAMKFFEIKIKKDPRCPVCSGVK